MSSFLIQGGRPLYGCVSVGGSKNAVLPILFATVLMRGTCHIRRVPDIADVRVAIAILTHLGARIERTAPDAYAIDTVDLHDTPLPAELVGALRASTYLLGATLARFGRTPLYRFGGCAFTDRPVDMHLGVLRTFGATVEGDTAVADRLTGGHVVFPRISVGATVNALLLAAATDAPSVIENAAIEPHVLSLVAFLRDAGARITVEGRTLRVQGSDTLHGASAEIIPDMIEAGTYLLLGAATDGDVCVTGIRAEELHALCHVLAEGGCAVTVMRDAVRVAGRPTRPMCVTAAPYPAFPTDLQPPLAALMGAAAGGDIVDTVFPERFGYLSELMHLGVHAAYVPPLACIAPSPLHGARVRVPDLRGGAAAVICALAAEGQSRIDGAEILFRGYEQLTSKLASLRADIREI